MHLDITSLQATEGTPTCIKSVGPFEGECLYPKVRCGHQHSDVTTVTGHGNGLGTVTSEGLIC